MNKRIIIIAAFSAILAVSLGAFGAHILRNQITSNSLQVWKTAVEYHFYHTLALIFLSNFSRFRKAFINLSSWFFILGIILFCGSLYLLSTKSLFTSINISALGFITPIGGLFFILGWISLLLAALKDK